MRYVIILTIVGSLWTTAAFAQEKRGYIEGTGDFLSTPGVKSGGATGEVGIKVAPNLMVFGTVGGLRDTHNPSLQTSIDQTIGNLTADDLTATVTTKTPAWFSVGGARLQFPNHSALTPYVFGGVGFARLNPSVRFLYDSGTTLSGNPANTGDDITSDVVANGLFTQPSPTTSLMLRTGAGVQVPIGRHLMGNVGYSVSRISADTPIHAQDVSFGLGIRF